MGGQARTAEGRCGQAVGGEPLEARVAALSVQPPLGLAYGPQGGGVVAIQPDDEIEREFRQPTSTGSGLSLAPCL